MIKNIIEQLAHSLGSKTETANIALAEKISKAKDQDAVRELMGLLHHKTSGIRNDAIKVLYEIGERQPAMIEKFTKDFVAALNHKDNRMKWGAMCALSAISASKPASLTAYIASIVQAMDEGTVITRDHGIRILCDVARLKKHHEDCMELLLEQIEKAPVNQVPMYAEKTAEVMSASYIKRFEKILLSRTDVAEIPGKQKRIEKLLKSLR
jgi:hypothetical protein